MSDRTSDFMQRLRERVEAREKKEQERLDEIMGEEANTGKRRRKAPKRVNWIDDSPAQQVGTQKASILDLLRDQVTTKSSSQRGNKD